MNRTVICIPYRNRKPHLDYYLEHTLPLLLKYDPTVLVVIVEQSGDGKPFNRGKLLNVAFQEYKKEAQFYITQDVDTNPLEHIVQNLYTKDVPDHAIMGIYNSESNTLGGIIKCRNTTLFKINGFPNDFWGWGVEDKALQNRSEFYKVAITKNILTNNPEVAKYFTIFNDIDDRTPLQDFNQKTHIQYRVYSHLDKTTQEGFIHSSGLNTLDYSVLERRLSASVHHLVVQI